MDQEMMDRLIAIQMKHNPQTRIGAEIVVTELLQAMREPTENMKDQAWNSADTQAAQANEVWQAMIDAITGAE